MARAQVATLISAYRWGHITLHQLCTRTNMTPRQLGVK